MDVFAAAKRQYRLQLRPDEVLGEARWLGAPPRIEDVNTALAQLAAWGKLESHPDTARVSSLSDFYRARFLYRLSQGGEHRIQRHRPIRSPLRIRPWLSSV